MFFLEMLPVKITLPSNILKVNLGVIFIRCFAELPAGTVTVGLADITVGAKSTDKRK